MITIFTLYTIYMYMIYKKRRTSVHSRWSPGRWSSGVLNMPRFGFFFAVSVGWTMIRSMVMIGDKLMNWLVVSNMFNFP